MPKLNLEAARRIRDRAPTVQIVVLTIREQHLQLMECGVDASAAETRHQLDLLSWEDTCLRAGRFD